MSLNPKSNVTLRRDLSAVAFDFAAEEARKWGYIGLQVAPLMNVALDESTYPVFGQDAFLGRNNTRRAADGRYNQVERKFGSRSYACEEHGLEDMLDDSKAKKYANFMDYESARTRMLVHNILLEQEARVASMAFNTTTYSANAVTTAWSNVAADVIGDINKGVDAIMSKTGIPREMISMIITAADFKNVARNTAILDQVKYTWSANGGIRPAIMQPNAVAAVLGLKSILVAGGTANTIEEGRTASISSIWTAGEVVQLAVLGNDGASIEQMEPAAWRTMLWTDDSPVNPVVERYYSDERRSEILRVRHQVDEVATSEPDLLNYMIDIKP